MDKYQFEPGDIIEYTNCWGERWATFCVLDTKEKAQVAAEFVNDATGTRKRFRIVRGSSVVFGW